MELIFAFLADHASLADGKLYVLGGGFSILQLAELPSRTTFASIAAFRFNAADAGRSHSVELRLADTAGKLHMAPQTLTFQMGAEPPPQGEDVTVPTATYMQPMFAEPGAYSVEYWYDGKMLESIRLSVRERQPQGPAPVGTRPN